MINPKPSILFANDLRNLNGGPSRFQYLLRTYLSDKFDFSFDKDFFTFHKYVFIINASRSFLFILFKKLMGSILIIRLGTPQFYLTGISWYNSKRIKHFFELIYLFVLQLLSDIIVFQSDDTRLKWKSVSPINLGFKEHVIYNGSEDCQFHSRVISDCIHFIVVEGEHSNVSDNFLFDFLDFLEVNNYIYNVEIFGNYTDEFEIKLRTYNKVKLFGLVDRIFLLEAYEKANLAIFTDNVSAACPNSVLELYSSGIPVIAKNSGAITEFILNRETGLLMDLDCEVDFLKLEFDDLLSNYKNVSHRSRQFWSDSFCIDVMIKNYLKLL